MRQKKLIMALLIGSLYSTTLYSGENIYLGDDFNERHSNVNESYIKTMAKNRAYNGVGGASYTKVDGKEQLQEALESGQLDQEMNGNRINQEYKHIEINNARINQQDLKNMQGDNLLIGSRVKNDKEKIMQTIDIKNSKIDTNKHINVGIISSAKNNSGISSINSINRSSLLGGSKRKTSSSFRDKDTRDKKGISLID